MYAYVCTSCIHLHFHSTTLFTGVVAAAEAYLSEISYGHCCQINNASNRQILEKKIVKIIKGVAFMEIVKNIVTKNLSFI